MKNKHLGKKTLSVFLAVMMLMTCWVFFPSEHNHASAASVSITYPVKIKFKNNTSNPSGHMIVYYYSINDDGSVDMSSNNDPVTVISSITGNGYGASSEHTAGPFNIPGWPYKVEIHVESGTVRMLGFYIGSVEATGMVANGNEGYNIKGTITKSWAYNDNTNLSTGSIANKNWNVPSWSVSSALGGATLQVPSYGTRTTGTLSASFKDQYGVTWPQNLVSYSINGTGATLSSTTGSTTVSVTNAALANFTDASGTKNLTLTASGAGRTSTSTVTLNAPKKDVTFENLFSLSDWRYSDSFNSVGSPNEILVENDSTIKIYKSAAGGEITTGSSYPNNHDEARYAMPVTGGKDYTVSFNTTSSVNDNSIAPEIFLFWYDVNNYYLGLSNKKFDGNGDHSVTFTAPETATKAEIRFDNDCSGTGSTLRFNNIAVYPADRAAEIELETWGNRPYTKAYTYKAALGTSFAVPTRAGYAFNGWYLDNNTNGVKDDGEEVTDATGTVVSNLQSFGVDNHYNLYADWVKKTLDIGYDNLFSLSDWAHSASTTVAGGGAAGGVIEYDLDEGYIKVTTGSGGEAFSSSNLGAGQYLIPVTEGETYVLDYDATCQGNIQTFVFYYNATGTVTDTATGNYFSNSYSTNTITFTVPTGVTQVGFRFGTYGNAGNWAQYKNIGLYKKADYDAYAKNYSKVREPFQVGDTTKLMYPSRDGYVFDGWEKADGTAITSVEGLRASETVYATWVEKWTVTFLDGDGSVLDTVEVKDGEAATAPQATPTKAADADYSYTFSSWNENFSNVTEDITVTPVFTPKAHTVAYTFVSDRTCTKNAMVDKYCSGGCGYYFFENEEYDGTDKTEWLKLGHNFEGQPAVIGTSKDGTHEVRCSRYTSASCGGTTRVAHSFDSTISTEGATCTVKGTVTKSCACGEQTQVEGEIDPNGHNYDETKGTSNNDNATHTVACTYDSTHTKSVNCTDNDKNCICDICNQELVHSYVNETKDNVVSKAECEKDAVYYLTCQCGKYSVDTWTDTGSALEHNWTDTEKYLKSAANCTDDEVYYKECSLCGISSESKTGATWTKAGTKWNHKFDGDYVTNNDGTHVQKCTNTGCTATGNKQNCTYGEWTKDNAVTHSHTCTACKYTPAAENHSWSNWKTAEGATGTAAATQTRSCTVCGRTETKACTYTSEHKDATCTTAETTTYTCTECGHGYSVIGEAAKGHDFSGEYKYDSSADTHQQLCANGCGAYGVGTTANAKESCSWTYTNKQEGKHTASCVCGNSEEQNCSGGEATCTAQAECQYCGEAYGTTADHSFEGEAVKLDGNVHAYLCEFCGTTTGIYGVGNTVNATEACSGGTATCSALAVCEICNDTYGELDTDAHKWGKAAADADNAGKHIYTCEYNNNHKKSEACVSGSSEVVAPTCTDQGYTIQTCKDCSYEWKTDYTDATEHNWVDPVCNNDGTHTLTCNNENADGWTCDETLTLNCAESAITFGLESATCTEQGYTTYQCTVCNYTWDADFVPATGHSYTKKLRDLDASYKRSDKTCTEAETYWYRCDNCTVSAGTEADKYADDLASIYWSNGKPLGHNMQKLVDETDLTKNRKSEATCTNPAVYYWSCSVCGEKDETQTFTYMAALGHDYQNIVDEDDLAKNRVSEATCTSAAIYYKSCSRCGDVSNDTFEYGEKTGHKMTKTEAVKETCTTAGNVEYYTCSNCGKKFKDEDGTEEISKVVLPALDHDWVSVAFKAASCEEDGHSAYKECSRCDAITGKTIYKATDHKFTGAYTFDSAIGYHSRYCVNDNCLADGEKAIGMVDAEGNNIRYNITYVDDEAVVVGGEKCEFTSTETDTDENGIHSHKLSCVCGNVTSRAYSDAETFVETVAPTCTENGYDAHKCPDCDATWQKNIVETTGHNLADKATSNGDGTHSVKCSECDYEADAEKCSGGTATCKDKAVCSVCNTAYGETTDHTYDETKWVYQNDATCTEDGTEKNNCTVCDEEATRTAEDTATGHKMIADYTYDISGWKHKPDDFDEEIKAPTCKDEGLAIIYCEMCSYYKTKTAKTDSTAHVWSDNVTISGNCATGVVETRTCEICGAKKSSPAENQDHKFVLQVSKKATCTEKSIEYYICSVCGFDKETHDNEALGHTWADEIVVDKAPTCKNPGRGYRVCTVCQAKSDFEAIAKLLHAWDQDDDGITDEGFAPSADDFGYIYVEATEAACAKDGYAGYFKCLDCSYDQHRDSRWLAVEGNFTPATGHADIDGDGECDGKGCTKDLSDNSNGDCECICHKDSWFMQIIYKILRFFWKLFKIGKSCDCGHVHY